MKKVNFELKEDLGDTISSKTYGVECLNCFESGLWQMIRQYGVKDYKAAIGTNAFFIDNRSFIPFYYIRNLFRNMAILEHNIYYYYGLNKEFYQENNSFDTRACFIRSTIENNNFVYTLYNNYYDSYNKNVRRKIRNTYHSSILTGYDDEGKRYMTLAEGKFYISYDDYDRMCSHFNQRPAFIKPWILFRIQGEINDKFKKKDIVELVCKDWIKTVKDWRMEIELFKNEVEKINSLFYSKDVLDDNKLRYLNLRRGFFMNSNNGFHGNLYLKLRLLEEITGARNVEFEQRFLNNRKQSEIIANLFGKAIVNYSFKQAMSIANHIKMTYVTEAKELFAELLKLLYQSGIIDRKDCLL